MPVPIIVPMTIAAEAHGPSPRSSSSRFSLIFLQRAAEKQSVTYRLRVQRQDVSACAGSARLTTAPTANVTHAPISQYQVKAISVYLNTISTVANPANIPVKDPRALARESKV